MSDLINQKIALLGLAPAYKALNVPGAPDPYVEGDDRRYLGETDWGVIMAPAPDSADWWEVFDFKKPGHMTAWNNSRKDAKIAWLELESEETDA